MRIRIPEGKWSSGWEVVIFPIWKITLHCFGNMSKLLNPGRSPSSSLKRTHYLRNFIISEKAQLPFKNKAFVYDLKACTNTDGWVCSTWQVAVVIIGSPSDMCCRVPGGGKVVVQAGAALEPYNALRHLYHSGRPCHMYNFLF